MNDLFIGGGGFDGFTFLGALEYIHANDLLDIKNFYGCSIGSFIGLMYISGKTPTDILEFMLNIDPKEIVKMDIRNMTLSNSILDSNVLDTLINGLEYSEDTTLSDVYNKTKVNINIFVTNLSKNKYQNLNNIDNPDIRIKDALKASMSIPFLFPPVIINNDTYIDGCCKNIYGSPPDNRYILGYCIIGKHSCSQNYFSNILHSMINTDEPIGTFIIRCEKFSNLDMYLNMTNINKLELLNMYSYGVLFAKDQLSL